jgi:5,10-methylenetetrahydrofolate reductase
VVLAPRDFFVGVCVSPFKQLESELMAQYYKLKKKTEAGAKFIITQIGYDARKYHELLQWLRVNHFDVPVLVNVYVLPYSTAKLMNSNRIPGCVVTDKLVAELAEEEGHHPDIFVSYNYVKICLTTHNIGGLSENDFIMAAKIDEAFTTIIPTKT